MSKISFLLLAVAIAFTYSPGAAWAEEPVKEGESPFVFPPIAELPEIETLPDPFLMANGKRVENLEDWEAHREYLKALLFHYFYGSVPSKPETFEIVRGESKPFGRNGVEERFQLILSENDQELSIGISLVRPAEIKRYPTVIRNFRSLEFKDEGGSDDLFAAKQAVRRGYIFCKFDRTDVWPDGPKARHGVFKLYPEYTWGAVTAWAWAYQVVIDALDELEYIDMDKIVATGHSRGGQATMAAGMIDERIDVLVPNGCGIRSVAAFRQRDPKDSVGKVDIIKKINGWYTYWYTERYYDFVDRQNQIPWDGHTLIALLAPRAVLSTSAIDDTATNTLSTEVAIRTGQQIYEWLGVPDRVRLHMRKQGGHAQSKIDYRALFDFTDELFFDKPGRAVYNDWQYPDVEPKIDWAVPDSQVTPESKE